MKLFQNLKSGKTGKRKEKEERKAYSNYNIFIFFFEGNKTHPAEAVVPQSMTG